MKQRAEHTGSMVVRSEADDEPGDLEAERLVKVLGDVGVGPEFCWGIG